MKLRSLFPILLPLLMLCWLSAPAAAGEDDDTPTRQTTRKKGKKAKAARKAGKEDEEAGGRDAKPESPLSKHPIPKYTDYSGLNANLRKLNASYRNREFRAYKPVHEVSQRLKIARYSSYENPTGIAFDAGDTMKIKMEGAPRTKVELILRDFRNPGAETRYPLTAGLQTFTAKHFGHTYVHYRDSDPDTAPPIQLQIAGGRINGVFTHHDDINVWKKILANAKSDWLDILGERTQWVLDFKALRERCPEKGPELVKLYDEQMTLEQQLLGWEWEGIHPGNHIMGRSNWNTKTYMHADGMGGSYVITATPGLVDVDAVRKSGAWGTSHEFGHINQTRPGMMWTGTCETTVNLFSQLVNMTFNPQEVRLEHETCRTLEGPWVRGGRFDCYINSAVVNRELWQFQRGPDDGDRHPGAICGDCFVILCPMWQMYLYNTLARGDELFYPRIFKNVRDTDESKWTVGQTRMKYLDRCCDSAKLDFSDFFLETGMLAVMNRFVNDYGSHWVTITEDMCAAAIKHARQYPKPDSPVVFYITVNSVPIYRDKLDIKPSPDFAPTLTDKPSPRFTVPGDKWANAVAFEVYNETGKLIRVCLRGLNQQDNSSTDVLLPEGATTVMAVSWDGKRYIIYSTKGEKVDDVPDKHNGPGASQDSPKKKKSKKKKNKKKA